MAQPFSLFLGNNSEQTIHTGDTLILGGGYTIGLEYIFKNNSEQKSKISCEFDVGLEAFIHAKPENDSELMEFLDLSLLSTLLQYLDYPTSYDWLYVYTAPLVQFKMNYIVKPFCFNVGAKINYDLVNAKVLMSVFVGAGFRSGEMKLFDFLKLLY